MPNPIAPTPPVADNSNQIATTAFVQAAIAANALSIGVPNTTITGGTSNGILYDNAGALGIIAPANSSVLVSSSGGVPSMSSTLPTGLTIPGATLTIPVLGVATMTSLTFNVPTTTDPVCEIQFNETITDRTHGYQYAPTLTFNTNGATGLAAFDDEVTVNGSANTLNHLASFQSFQVYSGTGVLSAMYGVNWKPTVNSGTVTDATGIFLQGVTVNGGTLSQVVGISIFATRNGGTNSVDRGILSFGSIINEFRGNTILSGGVSMATVSLTLANGLNSNITMPASMRANIVGPTGAFSLGGFVAGADGQRLHLYNTTAQTMTIVNNDASSTAGNRILTLTGANVVLRANATSFVTLVYDDLTSLAWIVESTN